MCTFSEKKGWKYGQSREVDWVRCLMDGCPFSAQLPPERRGSWVYMEEDLLVANECRGFNEPSDTESPVQFQK